jgi:hypothetical protein
MAKIVVKNDGEVVFEGNSEWWTAMNENDEDVNEMVEECLEHGTCTREYFSGLWQIEVVAASTGGTK